MKKINHAKREKDISKNDVPKMKKIEFMPFYL